MFWHFLSLLLTAEYYVVQALTPNKLLTWIAGKVPYSQDHLVLRAFFIPKPSAFPSGSVSGWAASWKSWDLTFWIKSLSIVM